MDALRRRIRRYTEWLDQQAGQHPTYANVLRAVAHRLRQILADYPNPVMHLEYGVRRDNRFVPIDPAEAGDEQLYVRLVTGWRRTKPHHKD